jgi:hypothetical protein
MAGHSYAQSKSEILSVWLLGRFWNFLVERYDSKSRFYSFPQIAIWGLKFRQAGPTHEACCFFTNSQPFLGQFEVRQI